MNETLRAKYVARFWSKVSRAGPDECWLWTAGTAGKRGHGTYGRFRFVDRMEYTHRIAYELGHGVVPKQQVLHSCDTPLCCNPAHLFIGTQLDNMMDMDAKGRRVTPSKVGIKNPKAVLNDEKVREIRRRRAAGDSTDVLASDFNVSRTHIYYVCNRKNWAHVA